MKTRLLARSLLTGVLMLLLVQALESRVLASTVVKTIAVDAPLVLSNAKDAVWHMPALPDGTPARTYLGRFFPWAFEQAGHYFIQVDGGDDYDVTVVARVQAVKVVSAVPATLAANTQYRFTAGTYKVNWLNPPSGCELVADKSPAKPTDPPTVTFLTSGTAINVTHTNVVVKGIAFTDGVVQTAKRQTSAIEIGRGGSLYADTLKFSNIDNGIHEQTNGQAGVVARHLSIGTGVRGYPVGVFGGEKIGVFDFTFLNYAGIEHDLRFASQIINGVGVPAQDILVAYGTADRVNDAKEPLTLRWVKRAAVNDVTFNDGYAVRLFLDTDSVEPKGVSEDVSVRDCTFQGLGIFAKATGCTRLIIDGNTFSAVAVAPAVSVDKGPFTGLVITNNTWLGGSGEFVKFTKGWFPVGTVLSNNVEK
jgi:hypothetical protein